MPWPTCDVCGQAAKGVATSTLGAVGNSYCQECLDIGAEPWLMLIYTLWTVPEYELSEQARDIVDASLKRMGKTWDELQDAVANIDKEYHEYENRKGESRHEQ